METEFCKHCHGNGIIICRCAGDSCACGMDHYDCPYCDSVIDPPEDEDEPQSWGYAMCHHEPI